MKISLKWLSDFVDIQDYFSKPEALAEALTKAGLEVEEITQKAKDFQMVVVGLILEKEKHPNADKLSLCRVTTGDGVVHQIVCGAQNHKKDDKVVVALPGAVLPGGFAIKQAVVRGIESGGMLCSLKELGLAAESEGILILDPNASIGMSFAELMGFDDVSFELKVTPNRADCLSHYGLAREVACVLGKQLKTFQPKFSSVSDSTRQFVGLEVKSDLCPRYAGRFLRGVSVKPSPDWLKKRLETVGLKSINNIVDVTNYVMMELGQPLHAFDAREIQGKKIIVEVARPQDVFVTLDGSELKLSGEELMIKDSERSIAMAGVVGGKNSGVQTDTTDIFLEAAYFQPAAVRRASRLHGVNTDSGYRFSRGVDPENTVLAMDRATELLLQLAGGEALGDYYDHYPQPQSRKTIEVNLETITQRLGYTAEAQILEGYLIRLGCAVERKGSSYLVTAPSYRFDLETEMDFVEEYARLNGYDVIPETLPQLQDFAPSAHDLNYRLNRRVSEVMRAMSFSQALNLIFSGSESQSKFIGNFKNLQEAGLGISAKPVQILNPLASEQNILRQTLAEALYKNALHNFHQGENYGRLFEIGKTFSTADSEVSKEHSRLGLIAWGGGENLWSRNQQVPEVFELKAAVEGLLKVLHISRFQWVTPESRGEIPDFIHRGQYSCLKVEGKNIGFIGTFHPQILEDDKIRIGLAVGEIDLDALFRGQPRPFRMESFSRFPRVERDLSLVLPKKLPVQDIIGEVEKEKNPLLLSIRVFDQFEGDSLPVGMRSVSFRFQFQDRNGTLQDQVINDSMDKILIRLKEKIGVEVR